MNQYETEFIETFGVNVFYDVLEYITHHDIIDFYNKSNNPEDLLMFGFHYGILPIVAFCYCKLKVTTDIDDVVNGYFKNVNSTTIENDNGNANIGIPLIHSYSNKDGIILATIDKFTGARKECMKYLLSMKKYSKYNIVREKSKLKYKYKIVDRYVDEYKLLVCY